MDKTKSVWYNKCMSDDTRYELFVFDKLPDQTVMDRVVIFKFMSILRQVFFNHLPSVN